MLMKQYERGAFVLRKLEKSLLNFTNLVSFKKLHIF